MRKQHIFTALGGALLFGGLVFSEPPAAYARQAPAVQAGGEALSCAQLNAESAALRGELVAMTSQITKAAAGQMRAARAAQAASTASSIVSSLAGSIPIVGGLIGSVVSQVASAGVEAQQDEMVELSEQMMSRGTEVTSRLQRIETLRAGRCPAGQVPAQAEE
jgi:hypothetical protein